VYALCISIFWQQSGRLGRGSGLFNFSSGMSKTYPAKERFKVKAGATFPNVLNHTNPGDLNLDIDLSNPSIGLVLKSPVTTWGTREAAGSARVSCSVHM